MYLPEAKADGGWPSPGPKITTPSHSELGQTFAVLARAQQITDQVRSLLHEYYPVALAAFEPWKNGLSRVRSDKPCSPLLVQLVAVCPEAVEEALARRLHSATSATA